VYYALGSLINVSSIAKELLYSEKTFEILISLLEQTQLLEPKFSVQIMMILSNLCSVSKEMVPWESVAGEENVNKLLSLVNKIICDLKEKDSESLKELIDVSENLLNSIPKPFVPCSFLGCGRKFPTDELLKDHWNRRHL
jgi:hypothetical protein